MKYLDFEKYFSKKRMDRYLKAMHGDTSKAMTLYRYNLRLSQELFTIISCFEVALRNAIDHQMIDRFGSDWLRDSVKTGGIFDNKNTLKTKNIISKAYDKLSFKNSYSPSKLLAEMEFGVWKYMFSAPQYRLTGQCLLLVFPNKPVSSSKMQYNSAFIFNELDKVNSLRNRIAHHEPICFRTGLPVVDISYALNEYQKIQNLFSWMDIDSHSMLYGLDHVQKVCSEIRKL